MGRIELRADSGHVFTLHAGPEGPHEARAWGDGSSVPRYVALVAVGPLPAGSVVLRKSPERGLSLRFPVPALRDGEHAQTTRLDPGACRWLEAVEFVPDDEYHVPDPDPPPGSCYAVLPPVGGLLRRPAAEVARASEWQRADYLRRLFPTLTFEEARAFVGGPRLGTLREEVLAADERRLRYFARMSGGLAGAEADELGAEELRARLLAYYGVGHPDAERRRPGFCVAVPCDGEGCGRTTVFPLGERDPREDRCAHAFEWRPESGSRGAFLCRGCALSVPWQALEDAGRARFGTRYDRADNDLADAATLVRAERDDALRRLGEKTVALENAEAELRRLRGRK